MFHPPAAPPRRPYSRDGPRHLWGPARDKDLCFVHFCFLYGLPLVRGTLSFECWSGANSLRDWTSLTTITHLLSGESAAACPVGSRPGGTVWSPQRRVGPWDNHQQLVPNRSPADQCADSVQTSRFPSTSSKFGEN